MVALPLDRLGLTARSVNLSASPASLGSAEIMNDLLEPLPVFTVMEDV